MSKRTVLGSAGTGIAGYILGRLTSADVKALADKVLDGTFVFLHEQGSYASFAIVMAVGFGGLAIWSIKQLVKGKQEEIDRAVAERDKFQKLFIDKWQSSKDPGEK